MIVQYETIFRQSSNDLNVSEYRSTYDRNNEKPYSQQKVPDMKYVKQFK